jgi:hypothetical protein
LRETTIVVVPTVQRKTPCIEAAHIAVVPSEAHKPGTKEGEARSLQFLIFTGRHAAATILLSRGTNPKMVSEMLGHASIAITLDTYSHVLTDIQQQQEAAAMDAFLAGS